MTDLMTSPSSSSTSRSTPCVLGCCGPMLTVIVSVRSSAIGVSGVFSPSARGTVSMRSPHPIALDVGPEFVLADLHRLVGLRRLLDLHGIVFPRREPLPVLGHQQ